MSASTLSLGQIRETIPYRKANITKLYRYNDDLTFGATFSPKDISFLPEVNSATDGALVRFVIPRRGYLDLSRLQLSFNFGPIVPVPGSGVLTDACLDFGSWNLISRIRVLCGSQQWEQIDNYGYVQNLYHMIAGDCASGLTNSYQMPNGKMYDWNGAAYNVLDHQHRMALGNTTRSMLIPINMQSITSRILPMKYMSDSLTIEILLQNAASCCSVRTQGLKNADGSTPPVVGTPTFTFSNLKLLGTMVTVTQDYDDVVNRAMSSSGGISWRYDSWQTSSRNVQNTSETVTISDRLGCINNVIALHTPYLNNRSTLQYPQAYSGLTTNYYNQSWCWPDMGVSIYAFQVDGDFIPTDKVTCYDGTQVVPIQYSTNAQLLASVPEINNYQTPMNANYVYNLEKNLGKLSSALTSTDMKSCRLYWGQTWSVPPPVFGPANLGATTNFMMIQNFESFLNSEIVDGLNTTYNERVFQLVINYTAALPSPMPLLLLVNYESIVSLTKTGFKVSK